MSATTATVFFGKSSPNEASFFPEGPTLHLVEGSTAAWRLYTPNGVYVYPVDHPDNIVAAGAKLVKQAGQGRDAVMVTSMPGSSVRGFEAELVSTFPGSTYLAPVVAGTARTQWGDVAVTA